MDLTIVAPIVASFIGLLIVGLVTIIWILILRLQDKVDQNTSAQAEIARKQEERFNTIESFIQTELRTLDVRLSVVETVLHLKGKSSDGQ